MSNAVNKSYEISYEIVDGTPEKHAVIVYRYPRPNDLNIGNSAESSYTSEGAYKLSNNAFYYDNGQRF